MSHTPTASGPSGNASQTTAAAAKPTLAGTRIRQRKGQAKATAKFEPETFRDQLLLHLNLIPEPPTVDAVVTKLVQAGATLEFLRYYEQLFELLFVGGLLQPGGSYLDDKRSPVYLVQDVAPSAGGDGWDPVKGVIESLKRVMQRYKYLQKPLEENFLPDLLGYVAKWDPVQRAKLAEATALLIYDVQIAPRCLASLTKDHVVKDNIALQFFTAFARVYLAKQSVDQLGTTLRKGGLKDIALLFPHQIRTKQHIQDHFKTENLPQINDWYAKIATAENKDQTIANIERMITDEEGSEFIIDAIKTQQAEAPVPEQDMVDWIWQGIMRAMDTSVKAEQMDQYIVQHVTANSAILVPFSSSAKSQIALINAVQVYCHTDTRALKSFPQIIKILYNADCISDQAIIYWHQKGAKPNGKQHFLKVTEPLVKFLQEQDSDEE